MTVWDLRQVKAGENGSKEWREMSKKDKKEKPTASSVPRRSPIQVLTGLNVA